MTKHNRKSSDFVWVSLVLTLLILPALATAGHEEVLNARWSVTVSKDGLGNKDCERNTCLLENDLFEVHVQNLSSGGHGSGQLIIERGVWNVSFDVLVRVHRNNGQLDHVDVFFIDDKVKDGSTPSVLPLKRMRMTLVEESNPASCKNRFGDLDHGQFSDDDLSAACPHETEIAVHWSICSLDPMSNCRWFDAGPEEEPENDLFRTDGVPDDGQGAGGPD